MAFEEFGRKVKGLDNKDKNFYLKCEQQWVYIILMMSAGYFGGYTYMVRGGVFCNAQTGNMLKFAMALGQGEWKRALYFLIPLTAYLCGTIISEYFPERVNRHKIIRWDTLLITIELVIVISLGFYPLTLPAQVAQVAINFICAMQYNTFRQAQHVPMATTFVTNHIRQVGLHLVAYREDKQKFHIERICKHIVMTTSFIVGVAGATFLSKYLYEKTIWGAGVLLGVLWIIFMRADLIEERHLITQKPAGH